jgi:hypothetical protein
MSKKSLALTELLLLTLLGVPAFAGKKDDLYTQAQAAARDNRPDEAAKLFCEVRDMDGSYKDAKQMCSVMTIEAGRELRATDERFNTGVVAFNNGKFDEAELKFRNVRIGPRVKEAKDYLAKIPAAREAAKQDRAKSDVESASAQKFDQAMQAYNRNEFGSASSLFGQVSGKRGVEAQSYIGFINRYNQAMANGERNLATKNFRQAMADFMEARSIKPDGPGDPRGKAERAEGLFNEANKGSSGSSTVAKNIPPPLPRESSPDAVVVPKNIVNVSALLADAARARAKGDFPEARRKYAAILAAEPGNAMARQGLDGLKDQSGVAANSDLDAMLANAMREFYTARYEQSETHIQAYLDVDGSKKALSYFYLGASKLTRYYLGGEQKSDEQLLQDAQAAFRKAKESGNFQPPGNEYISPRIIRIFEATT